MEILGDKLMKTHKNSAGLVSRPSPLIFVGIFIILATVVTLPFYSARSQVRIAPGTEGVNQPRSLTASNSSILNPRSSIFLPPLPAPPLSGEGIATFASDCATPQSDFNLVDVVCAKASGVPVSLFPWRISWVDPDGFIRQSDPASTDDSTTYTYTIPSTRTSVINDQTVDNRGTWRVN